MQPQKHDHVRHNFVVNVLDGSGFGFGLGVASYVTVLPLFINSLTDATVLIGLIATLHIIGWQLPQLFTAGLVARRTLYRPLVLWITLHERWPYVALVLLALLLPQMDVGLGLLLAVILIAIQSFGGGFTAVAWQSMLGKVIPAHVRGTFFGVQSAAANLTGSIGSVIAGVLLATLPYPLNFAACFAAASVGMGLSFAFLAATREAPTPPIAEKQTDWRVFWRKLADILRTDANFRWFLLARALAQFSQMAVAFYTIYATRVYAMDPQTAGVMTGLLLLAQVVTGPIVGWLGDRFEHRFMLALGSLLMAISAALALGAPDLSWFYLVFFLAGAVANIQWTTIIAMTVQFGGDEQRPYYIGLSNTLTAPFSLLAPLIGGWLADTSGFEATFVVSIVAGILSMVVLLAFVHKPQPAKRGAPAAGTD